VRLSWSQALSWRMGRQLLDPVGTLSTADVVRRLGGVQAQVASTAELAIRVRQQRSEPGGVAAALAEGRLIKTWAMRGTLHLLTPEDGGAFLSLMASTRTWELPSWQRYFGMQASHWDAMRATVREALAGPPLTREELMNAIVAHPDLAHLGDELRSGWGTLFKPLAWQGDLCYGPSQGTSVTFTRPDLASPRWAGVPEPDEAAPAAIRAYLRAYGPATATNLRNWLSRGRIGPRTLRAWLAELGKELAEVEVEGVRAFVLAEDLDGLLGTPVSATVRLVPGFDAVVLGPGTDDTTVVAAARRTTVSRQAGWISPVVVAGGRVAGTWELDGDAVRISWFAEAGRTPNTALAAEVERLSGILGNVLRSEVAVA
jgi:hypothetical protein